MKILACGDSMYPTLIDGMYYELYGIRKNIINKGDIIVYRVDERLICHRVIKVIEFKNKMCFYKTKGDNCKKADSYVVSSEMIVGKIEL